MNNNEVGGVLVDSGSVRIAPEVFEAYEEYVEAVSGERFANFHDYFTGATAKEGYKINLAKALDRAVLEFFGQRRDRVHSDAEVIEFVRDRIVGLCGNLVAWQTVDDFRKKMGETLADEGAAKRVADVFRGLYTGNDDEVSFGALKGEFGGNFDLLAYLMFSKNTVKYLPLKPTVFDNIFRELGLGCSVLCSHADWAHYCEFLGYVAAVRERLIDRYPCDGISLLDAHSFLWVLGMYGVLGDTKGIGDVATETHDDDVTGVASNRSSYAKMMRRMWDDRCAVTGCANERLLVASHSKPFAECKAEGAMKKALDPHNGLLLVRNYDVLFDGFLVTFGAEDGKIRIPAALRKDVVEMMGVSDTAKVDFGRLQAEDAEKVKYYLDIHNKKYMDRWGREEF